MNSNYVDFGKLRDINTYSPREQTILYITYVRLDLYNYGKPCGPKAIQEEMKRLEIKKIPSMATISRILRDQYLTHGRAGYPDDDYP
jgi:hypothetical protein